MFMTGKPHLQGRARAALPALPALVILAATALLAALRMPPAAQAAPAATRHEAAASASGLPGAAASAGEPTGCDAPWSYEGPIGPQHWGDLSPCYAACSTGVSQSPVDLGALEPSRLRTGIFHYGPTAIVLLNDGHTIKADYPPPAGYLVDGARFDLVEFHFHHPSEHAWRGKHYAMELHLVHRTAGGLTGVVGVFLDERRRPDNPLLEVLWQNLPTTKGVRTYPPVPFDAASLLPPDRHGIRYIGSLTTPPCTEGVRWWVLDQPIPISSDQLARFAALFADNARPLQPLNGRKLLAERPLP
jgi:carbonic anhydrase